MSSRASSTVPKPSVEKGPLRLHVAPFATGWQVRKDGAASRVRVYASQDEALDAAKAKLRTRGGLLRIIDRDGRSREVFTLGRRAMAKLTAVEGIQICRDLRKIIKDVDASNLSTEERLKALARDLKTTRR